MRKAIWIISVLAVAVAIGGYVIFSGERKPPIRYRTAQVERGLIVSTVTATGTINPVTTVQVGSQVSGMIESLHADFNSQVKKGQVVARIDPFPYRARRDQAAANLANAKAALIKAKVDLAQRKRELDRVQVLLKQQFVSQADVDTALTAHEGAIAQLAVAEAAVKQAQAQLEAAELDLTYTVIRSPVDGTVISRQVEVGQRLSANFSIPTLFLIAEDLTQMQVDTNVSESDIGGMTVGKDAIFTVDAYPGIEFHGHVRQVRNAPVSVQNVVTYDTIIDFDNPDERLLPGETAYVTISTGRADNAVLIPNSAISFTPDIAQGDLQRLYRKYDIPPAAYTSHHDNQQVVWEIVNGDLRPVAIRAGLSDSASTQLVAGDVHPGDQVITASMSGPAPQQQQGRAPIPRRR